MDNDKKLAAPPPTPEIDPELAAMEAEAGAPTGSVLERLLQTVLRRKDAKATSHGVPAEKGHRDRRRAAGQARMTRRAMERYGNNPDRKAQPHARMGRSRLKKSPRQVEWEFKTQARQELSRIRLTTVLPQCAEIKYVIGTPGLKNVWQLCQASTATIHAIPGFGPKRRQAVRKYLVENQVPVAWEA